MYNMNLREKIEKILTQLVPGIDLSSDALMEEDVIESLMMIQLISELDDAFGIEITFADIENNCFHSVEAIEQMVLRHLG